jgi:primase-polymerase (primpol)-like protein
MRQEKSLFLLSRKNRDKYRLTACVYLLLPLLNTRIKGDATDITVTVKERNIYTEDHEQDSRFVRDRKMREKQLLEEIT